RRGLGGQIDEPADRVPNAVQAEQAVGGIEHERGSDATTRRDGAPVRGARADGRRGAPRRHDRAHACHRDEAGGGDRCETANAEHGPSIALGTGQLAGRSRSASATGTAVVIGTQSTRPMLATRTAMIDPTIVSLFALSESGRSPSDNSTMSGIAPPKYASASVFTREPM